MLGSINVAPWSDARQAQRYKYASDRIARSDKRVGKGVGAPCDDTIFKEEACMYGFNRTPMHTRGLNEQSRYPFQISDRIQGNTKCASLERDSESPTAVQCSTAGRAGVVEEPAGRRRMFTMGFGCYPLQCMQTFVPGGVTGAGMSAPTAW